MRCRTPSRGRFGRVRVGFEYQVEYAVYERTVYSHGHKLNAVSIPLYSWGTEVELMIGSWTNITRGLEKYFSNNARACTGSSSIFACKAQFLVSCRSLSAFLLCNTDSNVSGTTNSPIGPKNAAMINVIQAVHRQPRELFVINSPTIGPIVGPRNVAPEKAAVATPRSMTSQKST
jgi:hypothetical protein